MTRLAALVICQAMSNATEGKQVTDAERLKRLYDERAPTDMSQAEFGSIYGIGTKAMVWQYLSGYRPLNFEAAAKFARGLRCTIADISPDMARKIKTEFLPVLGRVSVKAALMLMLVGVPALVPTKAEAAFNITLTKIHIAWRWLVSLLSRRVQSA